MQGTVARGKVCPDKVTCVRIVVIARESLQRRQCSPSVASDLQLISRPLVLYLQTSRSQARQAREALGSGAMIAATTTADVWIVELVCDLFHRPLNKRLRQIPAGGEPPRIVVTARLFDHRSWYRGSNNRTTPWRGIGQQVTTYSRMTGTD